MSTKPSDSKKREEHHFLGFAGRKDPVHKIHQEVKKTVIKHFRCLKRRYLVLTYLSCMDPAYVRENPVPKWPDRIQYLHFRYLKFSVKKQWLIEAIWIRTFNRCYGEQQLFYLFKVFDFWLLFCMFYLRRYMRGCVKY